jgi:hypothetical protein
LPQILATQQLFHDCCKMARILTRPIQAKSENDRIGIVQIEQDLVMCAEKFPDAIVKPIAAQFIDPTIIALFEFELTKKGVRISNEKHYRLVPPDQLSPEELEGYRKRTE